MSSAARSQFLLRPSARVTNPPSGARDLVQTDYSTFHAPLLLAVDDAGATPGQKPGNVHDPCSSQPTALQKAKMISLNVAAQRSLSNPRLGGFTDPTNRESYSLTFNLDGADRHHFLLSLT